MSRDGESGNRGPVSVSFSIAGRVVKVEIPTRTDEDGIFIVSFPKKGWIEPKEDYNFFFKILGTRRIKVNENGNEEELTKVLAMKISKNLIAISRNNVFLRLRIPIGREIFSLAPLVISNKKNATFWFKKNFNHEDIRSNEVIILELKEQNDIKDYIAKIQL